MMTSRIASVAIAGSLALLASCLAPALEAQTVARRVAGAPDGKVRFTFAARPDICGHGTFITRRNESNSRMTWSSTDNEDVEYAEFCDENPVRIVLDVRGGSISKIRTYVGGRWRPARSTVTDLGNVSTREATDFLLGLASSDRDRVGREAVFPMTLADSVVVWPGLLRLARDAGKPPETRKQAVFWLGQAAGESITANLATLANEDDVDTQIREQAVFALSQRRNAEGVPALIQIARSNRNPSVRKKAMFWLGQTNDPRAVALFEEILTRR
ncbi:MAG: HEAT repeat domain-containing protein [Gemmatimonadaceae bacterium]|nr:HEAT repeat domain-containing protein [Gemmatimonadaceae bacterium]